MDAAVDLVVGGRRLVPRVGPPVRRGGAAGDRVGQGPPIRPGAPCHRLDRHDPDVAFGTDGKELLGGLAVLGSGPQGRVDREHDRVEVEAAQRLEMRPGYLDIVAGDAREARLSGVAQLEDPLQGRGSAVELLQRGHGMGLVEVEHLGVQQSPSRVELVGHAVGIGPQGLAGDEELVSVRRQMRSHDRFGRPVLWRDVEVVHAVAERELQPVPGLLDRGGPAGGSSEHRHAALMAGPAEAPALHRRGTLYALSRRTLKTAPTLSESTAKRPGSMSVGPISTEPPSSCALATVASVSATAK